MSAPTLDDTDRVTGKLIDTYLPIAQEADHRINPRRWRLADYSAAEQGSVFRSYEDALQWMDASASIIRGCIRIATALGRREEAWQYAEATQSFFRVRKDFRSWRISHEVAEESARGCGPTAHARMLASLGECHIWLEDIGVAEAYLQRARALWIKGHHVLGEASCLEALCMGDEEGQPVEGPRARLHGPGHVFRASTGAGRGSRDATRGRDLPRRAGPPPGAQVVGARLRLVPRHR